MSTIINGTSSAITFPDTTVQNTAFTTGAVTQSTIATGVAGTGPAFSVYSNANQSLTSNTFTKVALNSKNFDTATAFDATTNYRFQPTIAGYYEINATVRFSAAVAATQVIGTLYKNGSEFYRGFDTPMAAANPVTMFSFSTTLYLNGSTDYIELYGYSYQGTTVVLSYNNINVTSQMSGALVRAA